MLFTGLLLLLFATYSCEKEEIQPETATFLSEILKNVNPAFLEHDLSAYKIKPLWKSFITFDNVNAVEVNFTLDNKIAMPSTNDGGHKNQGRQRLLMTLNTENKVNSIIVKYLPNNDFKGDIKGVNLSNFKSKKYNGKISFQYLGNESIYSWYVVNGKITKKTKGKLVSKKIELNKKNQKINDFIEICEYFEQITDWYNIYNGELYYTHSTVEYTSECELVEIPSEGGNDCSDPTDCSCNPDFPECSAGGGGEGSDPTDPPVNQPVFKYPMGSNYEIIYPKFTNTVINIADYVISNPKILTTLKTYTGLTGIEIWEKLQFGQGPTVIITQLDGNYGYHNPSTNTVEIDIDYVNKLENSTDASAELLNLMLSITLLHEFVHWTDGLFFNYSQENGNNWEIATYGFVVDMNNITIIGQP